MDNFNNEKEKILKAIDLFNEKGLEEKVISLANKAAKNGFYEESIGLLDNLLHIGTKNKEKIASLAIKYQREAGKKEK